MAGLVSSFVVNELADSSNCASRLRVAGSDRLSVLLGVKGFLEAFFQGSISLAAG